MSLWATTMSKGDIKDTYDKFSGAQAKIPKIASGTHYDYEKVFSSSAILYFLASFLVVKQGYFSN